jgi:hypothetical protein
MLHVCYMLYPYNKGPEGQILSHERHIKGPFLPAKFSKPIRPSVRSTQARRLTFAKVLALRAIIAYAWRAYGGFNMHDALDKMYFLLSPQQHAAMELVREWLNRPSQDVGVVGEVFEVQDAPGTQQSREQ